jgi:hypothetical protein
MLEQDIKTEKNVYHYFVDRFIEEGFSISKERLQTYFYNGTLPQRFNTSPNLANLAFIEIDILIKKQINKLLKELKKSGTDTKIEYTRYADDLTFSFNELSIKDKLITDIEKIIVKQGFQLNHKKTKFMDSTKEDRHITGIRIKDGQTLPTRKAKRKLRAAIHQENLSSQNGLESWCDIATKDENSFGGGQFNFEKHYGWLMDDIKRTLKWYYGINN